MIRSPQAAEWVENVRPATAVSRADLFRIMQAMGAVGAAEATISGALGTDP